MITDKTYHQASVPTSILGRGYRSWRRPQLRIILDHYAVPYPDGASKLDLMKALHTLSQRQPLTRRDKSRILDSQARSAPLDPINDDFSSPSNENAPTPGQICTVCLESFEGDQFPVRRLTSTCDHEPTICLSSLVTSISTQLSSKIWNQINCPDCGVGLEHQDIKDFADDETFQR